MLAQTSHSNNSPVNDNKIDFIISHHGSCSRISLIKTRVISMLAPFAAYICQVNNASLSNTLEQTYSVYLPFEGSRHLFDHAPHSLLSRQLIASWIFLPFRILWNCRVIRSSPWRETSNHAEEKCDKLRDHNFASYPFKWKSFFFFLSFFPLSLVEMKISSIIQRVNLFSTRYRLPSSFEMKANSDASLKIRDA